MRQALRILPVLVALLAMGGCKGRSNQSPEALGATPGGQKLEKPARTIASLSPSVSEILATQGASRWMIGRTEYCNYPPFLQQLPVIMSGTKPDYEKIAQALSPDGKKRDLDLIVYDVDLFNDADVAEMAKHSRMKPFAVGGNSIDEFIQHLKELSAMYTGESFMSSYVDKIITARNASLADPVTPKPTVALIMPGEGAEHLIAGKDSYFADTLRAATGEPVGPPGTKFVVLSPESLIQMNPDIIITAGDRNSFIKDPRFQNLAAIKNDRVREAAQDPMVRRGARLPDVINQLHSTLAELMQKKVSS